MTGVRRDRPHKGAPGHREWVVAAVRESRAQTVVDFMTWARPLRLTRALPSERDFVAAGGWLQCRYEAAQEKAPRISAEGDVRSYLGMVPSQTTSESTTDPLTRHREQREEAAWRKERADLLERLRAAEEREAHRSALDATEAPVSIQRRERASGMREATAFALASDWHVEETVEPATVNGLNAYDLSIAERRARRFFDGISHLLDTHAPTFRIRELVVWLGGDLITGTIHDELLESNGLSPLLASLFVRRLVGDGLRMLLRSHPELERIVVPCSHGNHGRTTHKPRISTGAANSYETALYLQLAGDFRDEPRVRFTVARGELTYLEVYGQRVRFTHGDAVKYGGGIGGIMIPINKAVAAWDRSIRADLTCMGHWHQLTFGSKCVVNGSLIGPSAYTVRIKAEMDEGRQAFFLMDSVRGVCQQTPIWTTPSGGHALDPAASAAIRERLAGGLVEAA